MEPMRHCEVCEKDKPAHRVHRNRQTGQEVCQTCNNKGWRASRADITLHCSRCEKDKPASLIFLNKTTNKLVCTACLNKEWRRKHPGVRYDDKGAFNKWRREWRKANSKLWAREKKEYYDRNRDNPANVRNSDQIWTMEELDRIVAPDRPSDRTLSTEIGRSILAIQVMRSKLRRRLLAA